MDYHTGQTVVVFQLHKRRRDIAELLGTILVVHPTGTTKVAWDNATTHEDEEVETGVRGAAGRLMWLFLSTYRVPGSNRARCSGATFAAK